MPFTTLNLGINLTLPTNGTTNWGTTLKNTTWTNISKHRHTGSGDGNQLNANSISNNAIGTGQLSKNYGWTQQSAPAIAADAVTIDWDDGNVAILDMTGATGLVTLTLQNPLEGSIYHLWIDQIASPQDITYSTGGATIKWPGGETPQLTEVASTRHLVKLYFDGTDYMGTWELDYS